MAWARFTADFDWPPLASSHTAYKAGMRCSVPGRCLSAAVAAGVAVKIAAPCKAEAEQLKLDPRWTPPEAAEPSA